MISFVSNGHVKWIGGVLRVNSSMFPIYEELVEKSEEIGSNNGIESRTIEN